jgi:hypothetical protein
MIMKNIILLCCCCSFFFVNAQSVNSEVKLKELAVPNAPAFKLLDISPSQIENPTTPKQFALGVSQSFKDSAGLGWPQNYSMEFAPYWWIKSSNRSVYDFLGLKTEKDQANPSRKKIVGENPFSGLKFTSVSLAFVNQDLVPDNVSTSQKIFSVGLRTTLIKIHSKSYAKLLEAKLDKWHAAAQLELDDALNNAPNPQDSVAFKAHFQKFTNMKPTTTGDIFNEINDVINQKPIFSLDVAGAYSTYGIGDSTWQTGRTGAWTTASLFLPLKFGNEEINKNYFAIYGYLRFWKDNYALGKNDLLLTSSSTDVGARAELRFDRLAIGFETIHRTYSEDIIGTSNRNVGVVSFQLGNNIYINGSFGKDFGVTNKLISFLGINWGFGSETTKLE